MINTTYNIDPYSGWNLTSDLGGLVAFLGLWFALAMGYVLHLNLYI